MNTEILKKSLLQSRPVEQTRRAALQQPKKRLKTKPKKSAILKRLQSKKHHSLKKQNRRKDFL